MSDRTRTFRRPDTGETKQFTEDSYRIDTTTQHSTKREYEVVHFFSASDADRIDRQKDGSYQDKWRVVWEPV